MTTPKLNPHDLRRVAVEAGVDPRTVSAYLSGAKGRSTTNARIREALIKCGLEPIDREPEPRSDEARAK